MKKEIFAGVLLAVMLAISIYNITRIDSLSEDMIRLIEEAEKASQISDWENAAQKAEKAAVLWESNDSYTHIVISHGETDSVSDAMYELLSEIYSQNSGSVKGLSMLLISHLKSMTEMEKLRLGSIF